MSLLHAKLAVIGHHQAIAGRGPDAALLAGPKNTGRPKTTGQGSTKLVHDSANWLDPSGGWSLTTSRGGVIHFVTTSGKKKVQRPLAHGALMMEVAVEDLLRANPESVASLPTPVLPKKLRHNTRSSTAQVTQAKAVYSNELVEALTSTALVCGVPAFTNLAAVCDVLAECESDARPQHEAKLAELLEPLRTEAAPPIEELVHALPIALVALRNALAGFVTFATVPSTAVYTSVRPLWVEALSRMAGAVQLLAKLQTYTTATVQRAFEVLDRSSWPVAHPLATVTQSDMLQPDLPEPVGQVEVYATDNRGDGVKANAQLEHGATVCTVQHCGVTVVPVGGHSGKSQTRGTDPLNDKLLATLPGMAQRCSRAYYLCVQPSDYVAHFNCCVTLTGGASTPTPPYCCDCQDSFLGDVHVRLHIVPGSLASKINGSATQAEANVEPAWANGKLVMTTTKQVKSGQELLMWYGTLYTEIDPRPTLCQRMFDNYFPDQGLTTAALRFSQAGSPGSLTNYAAALREEILTAVCKHVSNALSAQSGREAEVAALDVYANANVSVRDRENAYFDLLSHHTATTKVARDDGDTRQGDLWEITTNNLHLSQESRRNPDRRLFDSNDKLAPVAGNSQIRMYTGKSSSGRPGDNDLVLPKKKDKFFGFHSDTAMTITDIPIDFERADNKGVLDPAARLAHGGFDLSEYVAESDGETLGLLTGVGASATAFLSSEHDDGRHVGECHCEIDLSPSLWEHVGGKGTAFGVLCEESGGARAVALHMLLFHERIANVGPPAELLECFGTLAEGLNVYDTALAARQLPPQVLTHFGINCSVATTEPGDLVRIGSNCLHSFATRGHVQRAATSLLSLHVVVRGMFAGKGSTHLPRQSYFGCSRADSGFANLGQLLVAGLTALQASLDDPSCTKWLPSIGAFIRAYEAKPVGWAPVWGTGAGDRSDVATLPNGRVVKFTSAQWGEFQSLAVSISSNVPKAD